MAIKYNEVVPWGRSFNEYCRMFAFAQEDLKKRILGCGDGPASFNSICNMNNGNVISIDPIYSLSKKQILERIHATYDNVIAQTRKNQDKFKWNEIMSVEELGRMRMEAMTVFLESYDQGRKNGKYIAGSLPRLAFPDDSFDISLSAHFLFFYSDNLNYEFHHASIREMLRVSPEARIFPLVDLNAKKSLYVDRIVKDLSQYNFKIRKVNYEFQIGGNEMMIITRKK